MNMQTLKEEIRLKFKHMDEKQLDKFIQELYNMYYKEHNTTYGYKIGKVYIDEFFDWKNEYLNG